MHVLPCYVYNCSMLLIHYHLEELERVGLEGTMESIHLRHSVMRRQLREEASSAIFGLDILHGTRTSFNSFMLLTLLIILGFSLSFLV